MTKRRKIIPEKTKGITGLVLFSGLAIFTFAIFTQDFKVLIYAIPILYALNIGVTRGSKDIDDAVESLGFSTYNIKDSIPIGVASGIFVFMLANLLVEITPDTMGAIVPLFAVTTFTGVTTAAIIPASLYQGMNIIIQWTVVAPSEEIGWRFLTPYIANSFIKSVPIALAIGILLWAFTHIPSYTLQNVPNMMYLILIFMGLVAVLLIYETGGLLASWVMHGTFNTLVLITAGAVFFTTYIILTVIMLSLTIFYFFGGEKHGKKTPFSI